MNEINKKYNELVELLKKEDHSYILNLTHYSNTEKEEGIEHPTIEESCSISLNRDILSRGQHMAILASSGFIRASDSSHDENRSPEEINFLQRIGTSLLFLVLNEKFTEEDIKKAFNIL